MVDVPRVVAPETSKDVKDRASGIQEESNGMVHVLELISTHPGSMEETPMLHVRELILRFGFIHVGESGIVHVSPEMSIQFGETKLFVTFATNLPDNSQIYCAESGTTEMK